MLGCTPRQRLVYGDVLLEDDNVKSLNKLVFGSMGDFLSLVKAV